jgi:hypothetical protein
MDVNMPSSVELQVYQVFKNEVFAIEILLKKNESTESEMNQLLETQKYLKTKIRQIETRI